MVGLQAAMGFGVDLGFVIRLWRMGMELEGMGSTGDGMVVWGPDAILIAAYTHSTTPRDTRIRQPPPASLCHGICTSQRGNVLCELQRGWVPSCVTPCLAPIPFSPCVPCSPPPPPTVGGHLNPTTNLRRQGRNCRESLPRRVHKR